MASSIIFNWDDGGSKAMVKRNEPFIILAFPFAGLYWFWFRHLSKEVKVQMKLFTFFSYSQLLFGQNIDVTFRYVKKSTDDFLRVFVPGTMPSGTSQDWGPNSNGVISTNAQSIMTYNAETDCYEKTYSLETGQQFLYKMHFHHNSSGTDYS